MSGVLLPEWRGIGFGCDSACRDFFAGWGRGVWGSWEGVYASKWRCRMVCNPCGIASTSPTVALPSVAVDVFRTGVQVLKGGF